MPTNDLEATTEPPESLKDTLRNITTVIFDMDGLMLDTERMSKAASQAASSQMGYPIDDTFSMRLIGHNSRDAERLFREKIASDFPYADYLKLFYINYDQLIQDQGIPHKEGIIELLSYLKDNHICCGVATSTHHKKALQKLEMTGLLKFFQNVIAGDQVERGKPFPDIYLKAAEILEVTPSQCLALEDSYAGVRSAHAAGIDVVMVPDLLPPIKEITALAHYVCNSLTDVLNMFQKFRR
ncbi:MAG: HAD family phosphatase [Verrucomicrobiota bacterium]